VSLLVDINQSDVSERFSKNKGEIDGSNSSQGPHVFDGEITVIKVLQSVVPRIFVVGIIVKLDGKY
jgi:hypothetical protein